MVSNLASFPVQCSEEIVASVVLFTLICLAMAGHFQHVLAASDLSKLSCQFLY